MRLESFDGESLQTELNAFKLKKLVRSIDTNYIHHDSNIHIDFYFHL